MQKGSGVKDGTDGSTKMISKTMADVRALKMQLRINREVDHDFTSKLAGTAPVVDAELNEAAKAIDQSLADAIDLKKPSGPDFHFNVLEYEKDKAEIERMARDRLSKTDAQLADLAEAKRDSLVT